MSAPGPPPRLRIAEADGLTYETDVLVLKHAQALYGLDAQVVQAVGLATDLLPPPDGFRVVRSPDRIGAHGLLFVGTPAIRDFSYRDIRTFGYKALCCAASAFPNAAEITLTLHGVGYGLDEAECFAAEIAGILDAIESDDFPRTLEYITILEVNPARAKRLQQLLRLLLGGGEGARAPRHVGPLDKATAAAHASQIAAGTAAAKRRHAFAAMPFSTDFDDVFYYGIANAVRANELLCERIDQQAFVGDIVQRLKDQIASARIVIADVTGSNANVFLEVGYAWGNGVPVVLVCREGSDLKFDIQSQRCIFYKNIRDLERKLEAELRGLLQAN